MGARYRQTKNGNAIPIGTVSVKYYGKFNSFLERTQFPLRLCYAATIHKVQGLSLDAAVIYLGRKMFSPSMAYVALSRVRSLSGLFVTELHRNSVGFKTSPKVYTEMDRLRKRCT